LRGFEQNLRTAPVISIYGALADKTVGGGQKPRFSKCAEEQGSEQAQILRRGPVEKRLLEIECRAVPIGRD
jgi:hypothetical protein